ncbi:MAG: energy-coupling factor transporter transmembrane protein EcfT, partial [Clostridia bacterium]|nr:energy-coupling factor transporter transmembrane protein EcfT [Clostridia bacterium]
MKTIADFNPIVQTLYFLSAALCSMLGMNPVMIVISLVGALLLYILRAEDENPTGHLFTLLLFAVTALINPLFYHNGATVLLVINNNPITLEATLYGITAGAMIIAVLYHFRSFSKIMTSDRLMYVFGKLSGKFALTLSMTLRYIPLFITQMERVRAAQRTTGQYKDGSIADTVKSDLRVFSVMITWALENGIVTADSMEARGYGTGKRTSWPRAQSTELSASGKFSQKRMEIATLKTYRWYSPQLQKTSLQVTSRAFAGPRLITASPPA